jgi:iron-sulfur cluster assembly accessory protein
MKPVILTETAKNRITTMLNENRQEAIRFGIKGGGCSGFTYFLEFDSLASKAGDDELLTEDGINIIIDGAGLLYILGTEIDWVSDLMGAYFRFNSPQASSSCGCGHSVNFKV